MSLLETFLQRNAIDPSESLPLTHTTQSYHLRKLIEKNQIICQQCDVFTPERLTYYFVGRPAYKYKLSENAEYWNLPMSFVINYDSIGLPKRVFPFDSGGHSRKLTPEYLSIMPLKEFEVSGATQAAQKLIGAFFETTRNYFDFKGRPTSKFNDEFALGPLDAEIHALHKLSLEKGTKSFDDRNFTIELQTDKNTPLTPKSVLAVVLPINYLDDPNIVHHIEKNWQAQILSYDLYPLNPNMYYYAIYDKIHNFMKSNSFIK